MRGVAKLTDKLKYQLVNDTCIGLSNGFLNGSLHLRINGDKLRILLTDRMEKTTYAIWEASVKEVEIADRLTLDGFEFAMEIEIK